MLKKYVCPEKLKSIFVNWECFKDERNSFVFYIFPNPAANYFYIKLNDNAQEAKVIVTDLAGKLIMQKTILQSDNKLDISLLKQGVYLISVNCQNVNEVCKLVKLKNN